MREGQEDISTEVSKVRLHHCITLISLQNSVDRLERMFYQAVASVLHSQRILNVSKVNNLSCVSNVVAINCRSRDISCTHK